MLSLKLQHTVVNIIIVIINITVVCGDMHATCANVTCVPVHLYVQPTQAKINGAVVSLSRGMNSTEWHSA